MKNEQDVALFFFKVGPSPSLYSTSKMMKNAFYVILTLKDLFISESCIEIKIKLNFYFQEV